MVFPPGSLFDPNDLARPSPSTPFAFPINPTSDQALVEMLTNLPDMPTAMDSVTHVVGLLHVCGLSGDPSTSVTIHTSSVNNMPLLDTGANICVTLMDRGANICVMGLLEALVDVVAIPPLPISVAVHGSGVFLEDCCTHSDLLPFPLEDSSVYYQTCCFCKNIVENIISPQAIVASSDLFVMWQQTGHKDGSPGRLRFFSDSGLASITLVLEKRDGLYYAPTDVYTVDWTPVQPIAPRVCRVVKPAPPSLCQPRPRYVPVTKSSQTELELGCSSSAFPAKIN
jgi:hypothetical protein